MIAVIFAVRIAAVSAICLFQFIPVCLSYLMSTVQLTILRAGRTIFPGCSGSLVCGGISVVFCSTVRAMNMLITAK